MTTTKHTPGPWKARRDSELDHEGKLRFEIYSHKGEAITGWGCVRQTEANARLIAAAPEMLEALKDLMTFIPDSGNPDSKIAICRKAAVLAIRKAEEGQ